MIGYVYVCMQDEKEKKRLETINRKTTNKLLADEELTTLASSSGKSQTPSKVTQAQIAVSLINRRVKQICCN